MRKIFFVAVGTYLCLFLSDAAVCGGGKVPDPRIRLSKVSPYMTAGKDARLQVTVESASGKHLNSAMLDAGALRIKLEDGKVVTPKKEKLPSKKLLLGTRASIARVIDLKDTLKDMKTQTVKVWWSFETVKSEEIEMTVYEWDLKDVEAVIVTDAGEMRAEFYPDKAPITVQNFVDLSMKGFYDGLTFHRVMPNFMIQGGCPNGDGTGGPGYTIKGEFCDISHTRGVLSMARMGGDPDSAGSQFFIMHGNSPGLDGQYASFGKLTSGFEVLDKIAQADTTHVRGGANEKSRPIEPVRIQKVTIRPKTKE